MSAQTSLQWAGLPQAREAAVGVCPRCEGRGGTGPRGAGQVMAAASGGEWGLTGESLGAVWRRGCPEGFVQGCAPGRRPPV